MELGRKPIRSRAAKRRRLTDAAQLERVGEAAYVRAKKAAIIGIGRDLPRDLSTNPKHFDRFGKESLRGR
jgi:hypothetical protein